MNLKVGHKIQFATCLIVALAFTLFALYNDYLQQRGADNNIERSITQTGSLTAASVQNWMSGRILLLENLAGNMASYPEAADVTNLINQPQFTRNFLFTYLGSATSGKLIQTPDEELPADYDARTRPWYTDAVAANGTVLTDPYMDTTGDLVITIGSPVKDGTRLMGVAGADLSLDVLVGMIDSVNLGGNGHAFLVSGDGKVLVSPNKNHLMKTLSEIYGTSVPRIEQRTQSVEINGQHQLLSFIPVSGLPSADWHIGLAIDSDYAYASVNQFRTSALVAMLVAVAVIAIMLNVLVNILLRPPAQYGAGHGQYC